MRTPRNKNRRSSVKHQSPWWNKVMPARGRRLALEPLEHRLVLSTFSVVNTDDGGVGSLRWAIEEANVSAGADTIAFNIPTTDANFVDVDSALPGGDPDADAFVITPLSALPALSDTTGGTTIDGSTQTAFTGDTNLAGPEIVLDGSAILSADGLHLDSGENGVRSLNIQGFGGYGIRVMASDSVILGNYIGTDATGTTATGNAASGIRLDGSPNTVIGGTTEAERNVIADNGGYGIWVRNGSDNTSIQGNYIGVDATGTVAMGNKSSGVYVENSANAIIGGAEAGAGNVISGSTAHHGIFLRGDSPNAVIQGNRIGTDVSGTFALGNAYYGIVVGYGYDAAFPTATQIGGTTPNAGNTISANGQYGIQVVKGGNNVIQGNHIGTGANGDEDLGNGTHGVFIVNSPNNLVGGTVSGSRNVISANTAGGVVIQGAESIGNKIQGNYVGVDSTGTQALGNKIGVSVAYGANGVLIGTDGDGVNDALEGNVIAGMDQAHGHAISLSTDNNVVAGNMIGVDVTGMIAIRNYIGIGVSGGNNRIGTNGDGVSDELEQNVIDRIELNGTYSEGQTQNNVIAGNHIGVDVTGLVRLGKGGSILCAHEADNNRFGTNADGQSDELERNVIAGTDGGHGLEIRNAVGNVIAGNFIGVGADGATSVGGALYDGVRLSDGASNNLIGGTTEAARNVVSNNGNGIQIDGAGSNENFVLGNYIGLDALGNPLGNGQYGVYLSDGASRNVIGGPDPGARNVISANARDGIYISGGAENVVQGNYIGTDTSGTTAMGNAASGIRLESSSNTFIGGTDDAECNIISGNLARGIWVTGGGGNVVEGNRLGADASGTTAIGNLHGVLILDSPDSRIVGNQISGNVFFGLEVTGAASTGLVIQGNRIGTDVTGTLPVGNGEGIRLNGTVGALIGGPVSADRNLISANGTGIFVRLGSTDTHVLGNYIGTTADGLSALGTQRYGIHLQGDINSLVGGTAPGAGNLISGNYQAGIMVNEQGGNVPSASQGSCIQGNRIGTTVDGYSALGNTFWGIQISANGVYGIEDLTVGGTEPGAGNLISGNGEGGILAIGEQAQSLKIQGNFIGPDVDGVGAIPNEGNGIGIQDVTGVRIGGIDPAARNVISGNDGNGMNLYGGSGHVIQGNYIGTDATGTLAMGNAGVGINLVEASDTLIGGTSDVEKNVISGNAGGGVHIDGGSGNQIQGNYIGTDATGTLAVGNVASGIGVEDAANTIIGGLQPGAGNVISANANGVYVYRASTGTVIQGNLIGTDASGAIPLGNSYSGIQVGHRDDTTPPSSTQIGGVTPEARNIISNNSTGINLYYCGGHVIQGNYIGTDVTGTQNMGNPGRGIWLNNSPDNLIGGNVPGSGNLIAGDASIRGLIAIEHEQSMGNKVQGNYVGVDVTGANSLGNSIRGIRVEWGAGNTLIGTDGDGEADQFEGNLVAGNSASSGSAAIYLGGDNNVVAGNLIGTDYEGMKPIPNLWGVKVHGSNNRVGTNGDGVSDQLERNIVDSISVNGSYVEGGAVNNVIAGNYIGTDISGNQRLGAGANVMIWGNANNNRLGTNADGVSDDLERNVIAGRTDKTNGVVNVESSTGNRVAGNYIAVGADGTTPFEGSATGILVRLGSTFQTIGGPSEAERNVIGNVDWSGIHIGGEDCHDIVVQGNYIGVDAFGNPAGNGQHGVVAGSDHNVIGGTQPGEGNVIANNAWSGVVIGDDAQGNTIRGNSIYGNGGLGIDLGQDGVTPNDDLDADVGANSLQNFPSLSTVEGGATTSVSGTLNSTPHETFTIDFFANSTQDASGHGEGERWLGAKTVSTDVAGNAEFDVSGLAATVPGEFVSATATNATGDTSEFSGGFEIQYLSVLIDVMPCSDQNPINLAQQGVVPVAIFTTEDFDASTVNASTVVFAGAHAVHNALEDVDGDGDLDMILHFRVQETNLADVYAELVADDLDEDGILDSNHQAAAVSLTGLTATDDFFEGFDEVDLFLSGKNLRELLDELAMAGVL